MFFIQHSKHSLHGRSLGNPVVRTTRMGDVWEHVTNGNAYMMGVYTRQLGVSQGVLCLREEDTVSVSL